jgi:uncharacterized tellurite resistance protein B-like protein
MESTDNSSVFKATIHKLLVEQNLALDEAERKQKKRQSKVSLSDLELAVTVLLVDLASVDQNFDQSEYNIIIHGLMRMFGTAKHQGQVLVNQAQNVLRSMRGVQRFGDLLKENLSMDERRAVMEIIDDVINADGEVDGYEVFLRNKFKNLLGVQDKVVKSVDNDEVSTNE